jgi:murein DD-endopeptidase MepM/ murein hydrolase activator NlpD
VLPTGDIKSVFKKIAGIIANLWSMDRLYLGASAILALSVCALIVNQFVSWVITVDGKPIILVENRSTAQKVAELCFREQEDRYGCPVYIKGEMEIKAVPGDGGTSLDLSRSVENAAAKMQERLDFVTDGIAVVINGEEKLYVRDMKAARQSLGAVKDKYRPRGVINVSFQEDVKLVEKTIPVEKLMDNEQAKEILTASAQKTALYQVEKGDTLWDIARRKGMDLAALLKLNPDIKPHLLQIGQNIKLSEEKPLLNVISTYETVDMEEVPYAVVEAGRDPSLKYGEVKMVQQGVPGQMEITYRIVEKNGKRVEKHPVKKVVKRHPRPEIVVTGSEMILAARSERVLYRPVRGAISSGFGMRYNGMHNGIDIAADSGTPVVSVAAGTVKFAGSRGGYGLMVDIDHGNGMTTRYAHLSKIVVSSGQNVKGGELIGAVGATGNTTGPHLHFEVRIKGQIKDPESIL